MPCPVADLNEIKPTTAAPPWLPAGPAGPAGPKAPDKAKGRKEVPQFDSNLVTNVTVQLGENAYLRCKVRNLGEHKVRFQQRSATTRNLLCCTVTSGLPLSCLATFGLDAAVFRQQPLICL